MKRLHQVALVAFGLLALSSGQAITEQMPNSQPHLVGMSHNKGTRMLAAAFVNETNSEQLPSEPLVGNTLGREGYVAAFGSFSLSSCAKRGMFLARTTLPRCYFFEDRDMTFSKNTCLPCIGPGSIYSVAMEDTTYNHKSLRYIFFGAQEVCCTCGVGQRYLIVWDEQWCLINCVLANYGKSICPCNNSGLPCIYQGAQKYSMDKTGPSQTTSVR